MALNSSQYWSGALINSKGGNDITATDINNMISNAGDNNIRYNLAITDSITFDTVRSIAMSHVRYENPVGELTYGIQGIRWAHPRGVCHIVQNQFMPNVAGYREIIFIDTSKLAQRLLLDATVEMLAKTAPQQNFMIKKFGTLIDKYDAYANASTGTRKSHIGQISLLP